MPPKRTTKGKAGPKAAQQAKEDPKTEQPAKEVETNDAAKDEETNDLERHEKVEARSNSNTKRKRAADADGPQKAQRRSGRGPQKSRASQEQLLDYMLSEDAEELCRPEKESEDTKSRGNIKTYSSSVLNPFEELLCAVILSRPISHRLGLRTIRTVLNDPYKYTSAKAVKSDTKEKHHQALWDARTQHKAKTAEQIGLIADVVLEKFSAANDKEGTRMQKVLDDNNGDVDKALDALKREIKGLGETGIKIFLRRVQWIWDSGYPYVDDRTMQSLKKLGLPEEAEDLRKAMEDHWGKLDTKGVAGDDKEAKTRRAFVTVLERAVGADLEGKIDALLEAAGPSN